MSSIRLKKQFHFGAAAIVFVFCLAAALMEYFYLRHEYFTLLYQKTSLFMAMAQSSRDYVKEVLRPRMQERLPDDDLILEAMSTSFVSREIMNRLHNHFPEFSYKRAALDPRNPVNLADTFETEQIRLFSENPGMQEWRGVLRSSGHAYFVHMTPVRVEKDCLACHGTPEQAPKAILANYGDKASFFYDLGEVVAAETLYLPMNPTLIRIQEKTWAIFFITVLSLASLLLFFYLLFHRTVVRNLREILNHFKDIHSESQLSDLPVPEEGDEAEQIQNHLHALAQELRQAHSDLKKSETRYKSIFESSPEAILLSKTGKLTDINRTGLQLFAFEGMEEALGIESVYQLFWDGQEATRLWEILRRKGSVQDFEIHLVNRKGERRDALLSALTTGNSSADIPDFEATVRDITEKKRMDLHLAQTDKLASIGQLAAGLAHEINNPLGVIQLYAGLIEKACTENTETLEDIRIIQKHTDICKNVVTSLLDFSRKGSNLRQDIHMHDIIEEMLRVLAREIQNRDIRLFLDLDPTLPSVMVDPQQMKQVWMNLLLNAIQATPPKGHISLSSALNRDGQKALFRIQDTGHGISERNLKRIFEPFFTTRAEQKGTGLGLAVVYGIVSQHGGSITVESSPGQGSTFSLTLPLKQRA